MIALSLSEFQSNRVVLRPELADDLPVVNGDRVQLQQVILNLLRNASDAMSDVDDRPRELLIRTERDDGDRVRLSVRDAGVGFEPRLRTKLFEPSTRRRTTAWGSGCRSAARSSRAIVAACGRCQTKGRELLFRFRSPVSRGT